MKLRPDQHAGIEAWVTEAQAILRLQAWTIDLQHDVDEDADANATIDIIADSHRLRLNIHRPFICDSTREERQHTLTHELCHLLVSDLEDTALALMPPHTSATKAVWDRALEITVDGLADRVSTLLPPAPF